MLPHVVYGRSVNGVHVVPATERSYVALPAARGCTTFAAAVRHMQSLLPPGVFCFNAY
jgi:hypothetical protein